VKLEVLAVGITAGSREVPGRKACDKIHLHRIIIIIIIIMIMIICHELGLDVFGLV